MRYHGELSEYIDQALTSSDLRTVELIPVTLGRTAQGLTTVISAVANSRLRIAAKHRRCSKTVLANSALYKWLREKNG